MVNTVRRLPKEEVKISLKQHRRYTNPLSQMIISRWGIERFRNAAYFHVHDRTCHFLEGQTALLHYRKTETHPYRREMKERRIRKEDTEE